MHRTPPFCRRVAAPLALFLAALAPFASGQESQARNPLAWRLAAGDEVQYRMTWALQMNEELPGVQMPPQERSFQLVFGLREKVVELDGGVARLEATVDSVKASVSLGFMGAMDYDSAAADDPTNPMRPLRALVGRSFRYRRASDGAVTEVTGAEALSQAVLDEMNKAAAPAPGPRGRRGGGGGGGPLPQLATGLVALVFSDAMLRDGLDLVHHVLPAQPRAEGDTWTREVRQRILGVGNLSYVARQKHDGRRGDRVGISFRPEGEIEITREQGEAAGQGNPMLKMIEDMASSMTGESEITRKAASGVAAFSADTGRLLSSEATQEIDSEGPPPPMMLAMLGEQAKDAKMKRRVRLSLKIEQGDSGGAH